MLKHKAKKSYYGGDKINVDDEESYKLYIKDSHQSQSSLYSTFLFKSHSSQFILHPLDNVELFVVSGQSRFQLYLQQKTNTISNLFPTINKSNETEEIDLLFCKLKNCSIPSFPSTLIEELLVSRLHGLPLLIWPQNFDKESIQQYLDLYYSDCAYWFRELEKVFGWLEQKWRPLMRNIDLKLLHTSNLSMNFKEIEQYSQNQTWLEGIVPDCVAVNYLIRRSLQYERYANILQSYFIYRLQFSPAFHLNPIHRELTEHNKIRLSFLNEDAGFFNLVGNHLISCVLKSKSINKPYVLHPENFVSYIKDPMKREQCLQTLLSRKKLATMDKTKQKHDQFMDSEEFTNEGSSKFSDDESDLSDYMGPGINAINETDDKPNPNGDYPNRPITKEIMENRGIVKYRHKRQRNPRVHLRHKFRKACIRYRSRVAPVRSEDTPYGGEQKGIRVNLIKSHKFKRY